MFYTLSNILFSIVLKSVVDLFCLQEIAGHIIKIHSDASGVTMGESNVSKEENWLKRYVLYLSI